MKFNARKIFIISILTICIISINLAVYYSITDKQEDDIQEEVVIDTALLTQSFDNIFDNNIDYQGNKVGIMKLDQTKELVYTNYSAKNSKEAAYELNVNIPFLNINSDVANQINNEINNLFYNKAIKILESNKKDSIYNVEYKAYVNDNILSLIIKATLKEGTNAQRLIIKTYNYNLSSNNKMNIKQIIQYRKINEEYVQKRINETIQIASQEANRYNQLGYNKYLRNTNDKMYKVENTTVYFLGKDKAVYIIYPYGNLSYTSEIDLLVI